MKTEVLSLNEMKSNIDCLRAHLIEIGTLKGLSHPETIKSSQELDKWLYKYQKSISN
ncbi:aspartyl-phosphate phosphatase Spo0E family protein [Peribacillus butanolivorans]|uniref:aspartyl-phosphate phosphatase Spo0E family protein n=1 Tax=Peribacillus TaxID=2675229 RepID=UPI001F5B1C5B|nr:MULTISPECIES: aspartyl-phosphate phosphatase Spo0E family protein [Peribacillus]MED3690766.1 aspartyl-phosphate phosphatase Spo0E family protein [Peribacillus butanolivorans]